MKTYSHFLFTAALDSALQARSVPVHRQGLLLGSVMPDVPLLLLTLGFVTRRVWAGLPAAADPVCGPHFNHLYFHHPVWKAGHNLLHAPLLIGLLAWVGYRSRRRMGMLFWFALACGFHALIDVVTHHDDGPLLLFPLNWSYRFAAPISYWDSQRGGKKFAQFERLLNLVLAVYVATNWILDRRFLKGKETR